MGRRQQAFSGKTMMAVRACFLCNTTAGHRLSFSGTQQMGLCLMWMVCVVWFRYVCFDQQRECKMDAVVYTRE